MVVPFSVQVAGVVTLAVQVTGFLMVASQRSHLMVATAVLPSSANTKLTWAASVLLKSWSSAGTSCRVVVSLAVP